MVSTLTTDELKQQLSNLDASVRADLARFLLESLPTPESGWTEEEWEAELDRRLDDITSGNAVGLPAREVLEKLREKYSP